MKKVLYIICVLVMFSGLALAQETSDTDAVMAGVLFFTLFMFSVSVGFAIVTGYLAYIKGRSQYLWAVFGAFFGIVPLIIIACLKKDYLVLADRNNLTKCLSCMEWIPRDADTCKYCRRKIS